MKRPSFQFYPGDWTSNSNLKRCTHEQKGIWMDVLCVLHDQEEYGVCRWDLKDLAQSVNTTVAKLKVLVEKGILKGAAAGNKCPEFLFVPTLAGRKKGAPVTLLAAQEGPIWYSSRMVEDEYKRTIRGEYGNAPKGAPDNAPKPPIGAAPKGAPDPAPSRAGASSSSSSSSKPSDIGSVITSSTGVTSAGAVCARLKSEAGILDVNPQHPQLLTLLSMGLSEDEIVAAGHYAKSKGAGFAYALATAEGRRRDAAKVAPLPQKAEVVDQLSAAGRATAEAALLWLDEESAA